MKCIKCGEEIPKNCMYCSVCGKEVQLVPDYNFLEDDMLSSIIEKGAKEAISSDSGQKTPPKDASFLKEAKKNLKGKKKSYVWVGICVVIVFALITLLIVRIEIKKNQASSYTYQFATAEEYEQKKDYQEALVYYYNAWGLNESDTKALYRIVTIYQKIGKNEEAIKLLKDRIDKNPNDKKAYQILIELYEKDEKYQEIQDLCQEVQSSAILELFDEYMVEQPYFSKISGTYTAPFNISILSSKGYDIYYTVDNTDPVTNGQRYLNAISLPKGEVTVKAATKNDKGLYSEVVSNKYHIESAPPAQPKVTPASGVYDHAVNISIWVPADCIAYYTWDGSTPTEESSVYTGEMEMPQGESVLSVVSYGPTGQKSPVCRVNYTYILQVP